MIDINQPGEMIRVDTMLKATAKAEGGKRYIFLEASNEGLDQTNEKIMAKALDESKDFYLKFGNIDIDHYTVIGEKLGMTPKESKAYEIGRPVEVRISGDTTFVKAQLYEGHGPMAENANMVWEGMTQVNPPQRWYPSVGGAVLAKSQHIDPETQQKITLVDKVRWSNIALSQMPVNQHLRTASLMPIGTLTKSMGGIVMAKALEASYSSDVAALSGGGAFGVQSLDTGDSGVFSYYQFRDQLAAALISGYIPFNSQTEEEMISYAAAEFSMSPAMAADWVHRFLSDLSIQLRG
ncbi:head maturation protease [Yersinia phage fHe-Yen8-01]|nr:head maturation protease [Yersinia phage fHe-Yen8-01]